MVIEKRILKSILFFFLNVHPSCDFIIGLYLTVSTDLNQVHMLAHSDRKHNVLVRFKMSLMVSIMYLYTFYEMCA